MADFLDELGNVISYWPMSLTEGESSEAIIIQVPINTSGFLRATNDERAEIWAKWMMFPLNPYINISTGSGISLNGLTGPYQNFSVYVKALTPITGFERVPLSIIASLNAPAGWSD